MTVKDTLGYGFHFLEDLKIETAMLDSTVLLAEALGISKEKLFVVMNDPMDQEARERYLSFLLSRKKGVPVSYIRKRKEFFGLDFYVDHRVLVPRPDTEILVEAVLELLEQHKGLNRLHDVCTGTGCIPIALKKNAPSLEISASDISSEAGEVFFMNCRNLLGKPLPFILSDLFENITGKMDIITANPPYIPNKEYDGMKSRNWPEPELALRGGEDGLDVTSRLIREAPVYLNSPGYLFIESAFDSMEKLRYIMKEEGFEEIRVLKDLASKDRIITGVFTG